MAEIDVYVEDRSRACTLTPHSPSDAEEEGDIFALFDIGQHETAGSSWAYARQVHGFFQHDLVSLAVMDLPHLAWKQRMHSWSKSIPRSMNLAMSHTRTSLPPAGRCG